MERFENLRVNDLIADPDQPRKDFDPEKINELKTSILAVGVIQPIRVRPNPNYELDRKRYMIIAGERRWQASSLAGLETIPAVIVEDQTDEKIYAQQLTENLHRQDLNPVEKAEFINQRIQYLKESGEVNAVEIAAKELGVTSSWISKQTAILKYAPEIRALAREGMIRDYSLLKKIANLKGDKKNRAIEQIKSGQFNSKEFFARKRYDKPKKKNDDQLTEAPISQAKLKPKKESKLVLELNKEKLIKLIRKTDFSILLETSFPQWEDLDDVTAQKIIEKFEVWFTSE